MAKTTKRILVALLLVFLTATTITTPALARRSRMPSVVALPDGIVGEPYYDGRLRPRCNPRATAPGTTWDIWEGSPPPPEWSLALHERGLAPLFTPPWDLDTIQSSWYGTLPPGLYLDQFGGLIFGTPTQRGRYTIYASATYNGIQRRVPYHSITIRERLSTPEIRVRAVNGTLLTWQEIPYVSGYLVYVNGVFARKIGAVTTLDLETLNLVENASGHYINLVAVSTDDLFINSRASNSVRFTPRSSGTEVFGNPENPMLVLSCFGKVPHTGVSDITGTATLMWLSIVMTVTLGTFLYLNSRKNISKADRQE